VLRVRTGTKSSEHGRPREAGDRPLRRSPNLRAEHTRHGARSSLRGETFAGPLYSYVFMDEPRSDDVSSASPVDARIRPKLLLAAALGIGIGLGIAIAAGAVYWWVNREKPWNRSAVTAQPIRAYVADDITFSVQYRLRNNTKEDLRLRLRGRNAAGLSEWHILERGFRGLTPLPSGDTRLADSAAEPEQLFLPPGEEVGLTVQTLLLLSPDDSRQKIIEELRRLKFAGFVIYEPYKRVRIEMPFSESVIEAK